MKIKTYIPLFIIGLAALKLSSCKTDYTQKEEPKTDGQKEVRWHRVEISNRSIPITASGVLASDKESLLSFKIGGIIHQLNFKEGERVKKGQLLASLDLSEISAQVVQAQNGFAKAQRDLERVQNLFEDSVATLEQLQDSETTREIAAAQLQVAEFNLKYSRIKAPSDGIILKKMAERNELIAPAQPILKFGSISSLAAQIIKIGIADKYVVRLNAGDSASVQFDAFPNRFFEASVTQISEEANPFTGTFEIELSLNRYHPELKNGFVGYCQIFPSHTEAYIKVPIAAMIEGDQKNASVFFTEDQLTVQKRQLRVDKIYDEFFTVNSDQLSENQYLIIEGAAYLNTGDSIVHSKISQP